MLAMQAFYDNLNGGRSSYFAGLLRTLRLSRKQIMAVETAADWTPWV